MKGARHPHGNPGASPRHLNDGEFVDLLDGALAPLRAAHLERCETCQTTAAELASVASNAAAGDIPEPSPVFWEHLSGRVRSAIAAQPAPRRSFWAALTVRPAPAAAMFAAAAALALLLLRAGGWPADAPLTSSTPALALAPAGAAGGPEDTAADESDEAWALVRSLAEDLDHDEMTWEGISPGPGSAERLASRLTEPERLELSRLLEEQLKGRGIPESSS